MGTVVPIKGTREAPKGSQNRMETVIVGIDDVSLWKVPPFQRPLRVNQKVIDISEELKSTECIEGVVTLGRIAKDNSIYLVDGQHRREAFKLSGIKEAIADIRLLDFDSMADMANEFVRLNSSIAKMQPDDILRGLENSVPSLLEIRKSCELVGYDKVRRGGNTGPVLSMSTLIRCWAGSAGETPTASVAGQSVATLAKNIDKDALNDLITFLLTAHAAWGRDSEYYRLWGALNLSVCMWMWRRLILDRDRSGSKRYIVMNINEFKQCLMAASADGDYLSWLIGRNMGERDRSPCYARLKSLFVRRLSEISKSRGKIMLPAPAWASK